MTFLPKISIITITYNAEKVLAPTIESIIKQTYPNIEYIIIDGGSTDGTLAIVEKYRTKIDYLSSGPDKGLYDAMNKGIEASTGEYIWFMNAGDEIYESHTTANIFSTGVGDVYYGDAMFINGQMEEIGLRSRVTPHPLPQYFTWADMKYGMAVCHQAFIARKSIAPHFDLSHPYSADIDWEIKCLKKADKIINARLIVCKYMTGGFSQKNLLKSLADRYKILQKHFGNFNVIFNHAYIIARGLKFYITHKLKVQ